jgi:uncharacterized MAPEG superfamily protein
MSTALWCVLFAGLLPYFCVIVAKRAGQDSRYNNRRPREWAASLSGFRQRAYAAHQNHFEFFPFYAAAVIIADISTGGSRKVLVLSAAILVARLGYTAAYFYDRHVLRSSIWGLGMLGVIGLFIIAAGGK